MGDARKALSGRIVSISVCPEKGQKKKNVKKAEVLASGGITGDAHCYTARPLSLLPLESFSKVSHPDLNIKPGAFAENITTLGIDFHDIKIGARILLGSSVEIEVIQIGKKCHKGCIIRELVGDCIMPGEGIFARVISGGALQPGDSVRLLI